MTAAVHLLTCRREDAQPCMNSLISCPCSPAPAAANVPVAAAMLLANPAGSSASTVVSSGNMPLRPVTAAADPPTATAALHAAS